MCIVVATVSYIFVVIVQQQYDEFRLNTFWNLNYDYYSNVLSERERGRGKTQHCENNKCSK